MKNTQWYFSKKKTKRDEKAHRMKNKKE